MSFAAGWVALALIFCGATGARALAEGGAAAAGAPAAVSTPATAGIPAPAKSEGSREGSAATTSPEAPSTAAPGARTAPSDGEAASAEPPKPARSRDAKLNHKVGPTHETKEEGTEALDRFQADTVIKSKYGINGASLEVDPD